MNVGPADRHRGSRQHRLLRRRHAGGRRPRVTLLARPRVIAEIEANGLRLTSFDGFDSGLRQTSSHCRKILSILPMPASCW